MEKNTDHSEHGERRQACQALGHRGELGSLDFISVVMRNHLSLQQQSYMFDFKIKRDLGCRCTWVGSHCAQQHTCKLLLCPVTLLPPTDYLEC
jgi:hypothetical protein